MITLLAKKTIWVYIAIGMALLPCMLVNNALGSGPLCSPCDRYEFDYCTGSLRCRGCIADSGACFSCDSSGNCVYRCHPETNCKDCNWISNGGCSITCTGCTSNYCPSDGNCGECVGGACLVCGGRAYEACCNGKCYDIRTNGCCNGKIYDNKTQKCCEDISPSYVCDINKICCNGTCLDCPPSENASGCGAVCGTVYGGCIKYCFPCAQGWWFKEKVSWGAATCSSGGTITQTTDAFLSPNGCMTDTRTNGNGPPQNVGPCSDTTNQTIYCGPTYDTNEQCSFNNTQIITVSSGSSPGTVTTSSAGAAVSCSY
jgi:hypothetical protein